MPALFILLRNHYFERDFVKKVVCFVQFNVSDDKFQVKDGDHIGWAGLESNRFISRDDDNSIRPCHDCTRSLIIYLTNPKNFWPPTVRTEPYSINVSRRQFVFSAAVRIYRRKLSFFLAVSCVILALFYLK